VVFIFNELLLSSGSQKENVWRRKYPGDIWIPFLLWLSST